MINSMDTYIIRVYRRNPEDLRELVGMVEVVENQKKQPFRSYEELWGIMASEYAGAKKQCKKKKKEGKKEDAP